MKGTTMKATLLALLLLGTTLLAADHKFSGCTSDQKEAVLALVLNDEAVAADKTVVGHIASAFRSTAAALTAEALIGQEGYQLFWSSLDETDKAAIASFAGPPVIQGSCLVRSLPLVGN